MVSTRTLKSIDQLVELIHSFPTINPTPSSIVPEPSIESATDLPALITRIRAKYRLICSALGVKPRLVVRQSVEGDVMQDRGDEGGMMQGVEGVEGKDGGMQAVTDSRLLQF